MFHEYEFYDFQGISIDLIEIFYNLGILYKSIVSNYFRNLTNIELIKYYDECIESDNDLEKIIWKFII